MKKFISLLLITLLFTSGKTFSQCAMCKAVVESGDTEVAQGLNDGIMYLMVFPYILVGGLLYFIYRYKIKSKN